MIVRFVKQRPIAAALIGYLAAAFVAGIIEAHNDTNRKVRDLVADLNDRADEIEGIRARSIAEEFDA